MMLRLLCAWTSVLPPILFVHHLNFSRVFGKRYLSMIFPVVAVKEQKSVDCRFAG